MNKNEQIILAGLLQIRKLADLLIYRLENKKKAKTRQLLLRPRADGARVKLHLKPRRNA